MNIAKENSGEGSQEPETHTTALVFLVVVAAIICFLAYSWSGAIAEQIRLVDHQTSDTQTQQPAGADSGTAEAASDLELPEGMPVDEGQVVSNEDVQIDDAPAQVVVFESSEPTADLHDAFSSWLTGHNFELMKERQGSMAASLAAVNGDRNIIVLISHLDQSGLSKVEVINSVNG